MAVDVKGETFNFEWPECSVSCADDIPFRNYALESQISRDRIQELEEYIWELEVYMFNVSVGYNQPNQPALETVLTQTYLEANEEYSLNIEREFNEEPYEGITSKTDNDIMQSIAKLDAEIEEILSERRLSKLEIELNEILPDRISSKEDNEVITSIQEIDAKIERILSESKISISDTEFKVLSDKMPFKEEVSMIDDELSGILSQAQSDKLSPKPANEVIISILEIDAKFDNILSDIKISNTDREFVSVTDKPLSTGKSLKTEQDCSYSLDEADLEQETEIEDILYKSIILEPDAESNHLCPEDNFTEEFREIVFLYQLEEEDTEFNNLPFDETVCKDGEDFNQISAELTNILFNNSTTDENGESKNLESNKTTDLEFESKKRAPIQNLSRKEAQDLMKRLKICSHNQRQKLFNFLLKINSQKQVKNFLKYCPKINSQKQSKSFMKYVLDPNPDPQTTDEESGDVAVEYSDLKPHRGSDELTIRKKDANDGH